MASASDVFSGRDRYTLVVTSNQLSQSIPNNTSTVSIVVTIVETTENGSWSNTAASWNSSVNGSKNSGSFTYDFRNYNSFNIFSSSKVISHNSDGKKSIWFEASVGGSTILGSAYAGATLVLSTIPRASTSVWAPGTVAPTYAGQTYTLNTNRASSSFTHTLTYKFGNATGTIGTGVGASVAWTIPLSLLDQIPNAPTGSGIITTKTYNGSTLIGTTTSTFGATVPTTVIPTWTSVSTSEGVPDVATKVGALVQGVSKISYSIVGAAGVYSSTITQQRFQVAGQTVDGATGTTPQPITASGTVPVTFTITDSRGKQKTQTNNLTVLPYTTPIINSYQVIRSLSDGTSDPDGGTYLKVIINAAVQSLINGTQKNSIVFKVYTKLKTSSTWTLSRTLTPGGISYNSSFVVTGPFLVDQAYDVRVEVSDIFNTSAAQSTVAVAAIFMHWGAGLGVNKYHEQGALDVGGDIYQKSKKVYSLQQTLYFSSSGSFTKASYPWLSAVRVRLVGGGGGGGGSSAPGSVSHSQGGGGGGGGYAEAFIPVASLPSSVPIAVGVGGGASVGAAGSPGGDSSFGSLVSATGGGGGAVSTTSDLYVLANGGSGGIGTAGDFLSSGHVGTLGTGYGTLGTGGSGGGSQLGGGGRSTYTGASGGTITGLDGGNYGGGGAGGSSNQSGSAARGGFGAPGIVIVELYA